MTMSMWVFLLIIGLALLTGHGARAKAAAVIFFLLGVVMAGTFFGSQVNDALNHVQHWFS